MPSTTRKTLKTLFRAFARSATQSFDHAESQFVTRFVSVTATLAESALFTAVGPVYVKSIKFYPDTAISSDNSNKYVIVVKDKGAAGDGTDQVASFSTYGNALTAFVPVDVYAPVSPGYALEDGESLSVTATLTGTATLQGCFVVEAAAIID